MVLADSLSDLPPRFTGHIQPCLSPARVMGCSWQGWRPELDLISRCSDVPDGMDDMGAANSTAECCCRVSSYGWVALFLCSAGSCACVPAAAASCVARAPRWTPTTWWTLTCDSSWWLQICKANYSNKFLQLKSWWEQALSVTETWGPCTHSWREAPRGRFWGSSGLTAPHCRAGPVLWPAAPQNLGVLCSRVLFGLGCGVKLEAVPSQTGWWWIGHGAAGWEERGGLGDPSAPQLLVLTGLLWSPWPLVMERGSPAPSPPAVQGSPGVPALCLYPSVAGFWGVWQPPATPCPLDVLLCLQHREGRCCHGRGAGRGRAGPSTGGWDQAQLSAWATAGNPASALLPSHPATANPRTPAQPTNQSHTATCPSHAPPPPSRPHAASTNHNQAIPRPDQ